ncbi:MAG: Nif11-like leader peptide family natural product precursor [Defluviicoccus sp.]
MSRQSFLQFLLAASENPAALARYSLRNLPEVLFHARNDGFDFTAEDVGNVIGPLEANVILNKDGDPFDGTSRLWREMWGRPFLEYVVHHVVRRHTVDELRGLIGEGQGGGG